MLKTLLKETYRRRILILGGGNGTKTENYSSDSHPNVLVLDVRTGTLDLNCDQKEEINSYDKWDSKTRGWTLGLSTSEDILAK